MREVHLLSSELAYLLTLLKAHAAIGVRPAVFPEERESRLELCKTGREALRRRAWVNEDNGKGAKAINPDLMAIVRPVAKPQLAIVTDLRQGKAKLPTRIVHYILDDAVVEQSYQQQGGYRLSLLKGLDEGLFRVVRALGIPAKNRIGDEVVTLSASQSEDIKQAMDARRPNRALSELQNLGVSDSAARAAVLSMAEPKLCGTISCLALQGSTIEGANGMAYFVGEGGCWLLIRCNSLDDNVVLRTTNDSGAWAAVSGLIRDLRMTAGHA